MPTKVPLMSCRLTVLEGGTSSAVTSAPATGSSTASAAVAQVKGDGLENAFGSDIVVQEPELECAYRESNCTVNYKYS